MNYHTKWNDYKDQRKEKEKMKHTIQGQLTFGVGDTILGGAGALSTEINKIPNGAKITYIVKSADGTNVTVFWSKEA